MKHRWYLLLVLVTTTVIFSGCTESLDKEQQTVEIIASGAPVHNVNGIIFDVNDQLYVASMFGGEILAINPETGEIINKVGIESGVKCPDDLIFGPDGSLYHTDTIVGEVGRLSAEGVYSNQFVAHGTNSITFSDDGRLFVTLDFMEDGLYEIDPTFSSEPRLIAANLGWLNGMDWGPDGYLYGPIWTKGEVVRIDVDSGNITTVVGGFSVPSAVKFDSLGRLYVADYKNGNVSRIYLNNGTKEVIVDGIGEHIDNIAFDSTDRLFVAANDGYIFEILADGSKREVLKGGMIGPGGVAVYSDTGHDSVFIADLFNLRQLNGQTGEEIYVERHIMGDVSNYSGTASGDITAPLTVSSDGDKLIISSWIYNVVQVWDPVNHKLIEEHLNFSVPTNAIRFQGDLVVAELGFVEGTASILKVNDTDRITLATGLAVPAGLAATENDLWVSDWYTGIVLQLVKDAETLAEPVPVATNLSFPEGLAVDTDGNLLVVETGTGSLLKVDLKTREISNMAKNLGVGLQPIPGVPPTYIFNGVAVSPSGTIYVTGDIENVLYRIRTSS